METEADISVLSSWCPEQGGDVCELLLHHIIKLINITAHDVNATPDVLLSLSAPPHWFLQLTGNKNTSKHIFHTFMLRLK